VYLCSGNVNLIFRWVQAEILTLVIDMHEPDHRILRLALLRQGISRWWPGLLFNPRLIRSCILMFDQLLPIAQRAARRENCP
jgi:hypothetical protein